MAKGYISNRQKNLKIGINSYTENQTVLEVIGKVGIGTTNATSKLTVGGDVSISGVTTTGLLNVGVGGTIITTTGIGSVGIGSTQPNAILDVNPPSGYTGYLLYANSQGNSQFRVNYDGETFVQRLDVGAGRVELDGIANTGGVWISSNKLLAFSNSFSNVNTRDVHIERSAAGVLAIREGDSHNKGNHATLQLGDIEVYNTYTSATDFERANVGWTTNTFIVGTEKGSAGGTARQLELQTDGTTRVAITTTGNVGFGTTSPQTKVDINGILGFTAFGNNVRIGSTETGANLTPGTFSGVNNVFIGPKAGNLLTTGYENIFIGRNSGEKNNSYRNISIGNYAFYNDTYFSRLNVIIGSQAAAEPTQYLQGNVIIGEQAGRAAQGLNNVFLGTYAGKNSTGNRNVFLGFDAGTSNTGNVNVAIGDYAGGLNTGAYNNLFGYFSGGSNTTGSYNAFFGAYSGGSNTTGSYNTFFGAYAGSLSTTASRKVIFGSGGYGKEFDAPDPTKDTQLAIGVRTDANPSKYWIVGNENFNVGIGTTNPQYKLDVGGDINFTGTLYQNNTQFVTSRWTAGTGDNIYRLNGSVGIGTTNPTSTLTVDGTLNVSGVATFQNDVYLGAGLYDNNNLSGSTNYVPVADGVGGWTWQPITSAGAGVLDGIAVKEEGSIVGTSGSITTLDFYGNNIVVEAVVGGAIATITSSDTPTFDTLNVSGISTFTNGPVFVGSGTSTGTASQRLQVTGGAYVSGNLGIGTTNPTEKLTVGGNILINDTTLQGSIKATTSTTSAVGIHSALPIATYRSVEYTIQVTEGSNFHATKIHTLHDGSTSYSTQYAIIHNNGPISTFSVDISGGNIRLLATPASSSTTNYIINFVATKI